MSTYYTIMSMIDGFKSFINLAVMVLTIVAGLLTEKEEYKREEVLKLMGEKSGSYSMYRDRLIKRGILNSRQGYISLALPYFGEYIKEYC